MTTTCRICEQPIETPDTIEGPRLIEHSRCRKELPPCEHEPTYQSDLHSLVALTYAGVRAARSEEPDVPDAPLNVEEAVRLTEALLPAPPAAPRRRMRVAALPLLALAGAGVIVQGSQLVRDASPLPMPAVTTTRATALVEAVSSPLAATSVAVVEPEPHRDPEASVRAPTPASTIQPIPARSQPTATSHPRPASLLASTTTPAPSVTTVPESPSLMQAITDAVRSGPSPADRR